MSKKLLFGLALVFFLLTVSGCGGRTDYKEVYRRQGIQALDEGRYDDAVTAFMNALSESRGLVKPVDVDIDYYLGYSYYQSGDYEAAERVFSAIVEYNPKETDAFYYRGKSRLYLGDQSGAEEDFLKVTSADPQNYDLYIDIYFCLCDAGFTTAGTNYLQATLDNAKNMSDYDRGRICYYLGNYSDARVYLEKAKNSQNMDTILMLGKTYEAISDYSYAASLYNEYLSQKGNNAAVYNQLGVCRIKMKDYEAALAAFSSGLNLGDVSWEQELMYNEAITYEYMLDFDNARAKMQEYLSKYPKDETAQREYVFLETR